MSLSVVTRASNGNTPLTYAQMDKNFTDIRDAINNGLPSFTAISSSTNANYNLGFLLDTQHLAFNSNIYCNPSNGALTATSFNTITGLATATPLANSGLGGVGSSFKAAKEDHYHPASGGTGTVTSASVVTANGFAGTIATATSTPAITLTTTISGILKGNGTSISSASAGTDYLAVAGSAAPTFPSTIIQKSDSSGITDLNINPFAKTSGDLFSAGILGASFFRIGYDSGIYLSTGGFIRANNIASTAVNQSFNLNNCNYSSNSAVGTVISSGTYSQTGSGTNIAASISPTYSQTASSASNTDLLINRIESSIGSGTQLLIDAQVGGSSKFKVDRTGAVTVGSISNPLLVGYREKCATLTTSATPTFTLTNGTVFEWAPTATTGLSVTLPSVSATGESLGFMILFTAPSSTYTAPSFGTAVWIGPSTWSANAPATGTLCLLVFQSINGRKWTYQTANTSAIAAGL